MDADKAVEIIRKIGVGDLGYYDGCLCANFAICAVHVDVSCRKSSGAKPEEFWGIMVRVYSTYLDHEADGLRRVANEVIRQLRKAEESTPLMVRYCDYGHDSDLKCTYCSKPRADYSSYLCEACKVNKDAFGRPISDRDYSRLEPWADPGGQR